MVAAWRQRAPDQLIATRQPRPPQPPTPRAIPPTDMPGTESRAWRPPAKVVELCGRLPLALRITAALVRHRRTWRVEHVVAELRDNLTRLEVFDDSSRRLSVAFDLSYRSLSGDQKVLFRRLGQVPGTDVDAYAAAALIDGEPKHTRRLLQELVDLDLLTEVAFDRYRLHDLLREYSRSRCELEDTESDRAAALDRLLDYYLYTAQDADRYVRREPPAHIPAVTLPPRFRPDFDGRASADSWLALELGNLMAAAGHAAHLVGRVHTCAIPAALAAHLRNHGLWTQALNLHSSAAEYARAHGDHLSLACALIDLGRIRSLTSDYASAVASHTEAMQLYQSLDIPRGRARALNNMGGVLIDVGDYSGAIAATTEALEIYQRLDEPKGVANSLANLGGLWILSGDPTGAIKIVTEALALNRRLQEPNGQANALMELGRAYSLTGRYSEAAEALTESLALYQDLNQANGQANVLTLLGIVRYLTGDYQGATNNLTSALHLYQSLNRVIGQANALTQLGTVRRLTGDHDGAFVDLEEAMRLYRKSGIRGSEAAALHHHAAALAASGRVDQALQQYREALRMNRELERPADQGLSHEGIGECLARSGEAMDGREHLLQALTIFQRIGMQADVQRVRKRLEAL